MIAIEDPPKEHGTGGEISGVPAAATANTKGPRQIACMEVWGGNGAFEGAVSAPGADIFVSSTPHAGSERGGDIFYISNCAAGIITRIALADVSGHGESAEALATSLRRLMRKHINTADQTRSARAINEEFGRLAETGRFATALLATYFAPTDHLIICNAGHPPPALYRAATGRWSLLDCDHADAVRRGGRPRGLSNLPLGVIAPTRYTQYAVALQPDDRVVMYSDAMVELRSPDGSMLGPTGLLDLLEAATPGEPTRFHERALQAAREMTGGRFDDDATLIVLHHNAANPPRHTMHDRFAALARRVGLS